MRGSLAALFILLGSACSSCKEDVVLSSLKIGGDDVTVRHRVCGGVAGYAVRIAPPNEDVRERVDKVEPFLTSCNCFDPRALVPLSVQVVGDRRLRIVYDAAKMTIDKQRTRQGDYAIEYMQAPLPNQK